MIAVPCAPTGTSPESLSKHGQADYWDIAPEAGWLIASCFFVLSPFFIESCAMPFFDIESLDMESFAIESWDIAPLA